ncbi:hypothetical protein [Nocardiopsis sp. NRRL B-16309]|uniref:hypothetical protein n=1 Tax=Nocardiopsis sp. NRRL B-16309 TaxID=1519494 RepID=UPI0006AECB2B|nr:hypothetical protein [Nocardiopsis sp. NRRL B-16309]KOX11216.1 hypothetical protein ADL05_23410 [Nocardiopsis sp. NRRL B-16309]
MTHGVPPYHRRSLHDHVALDEIELYAEVLIAVADADRPLRPAEIDRVLGLAPAPPPACVPGSAAAADPAPTSRGDEPTRPPGPSGPTGPPSRVPGRGPDPAPPPPDERESDTSPAPGSALVPEPRPLPAPLPVPGPLWSAHPLAFEVPLPSAPPPPPTALWAH